MSLNDRFTAFLGKLPNAESLDGPGVFPPRYSGDRADFAFDDRSVIVEMKFLQRDPSARVQRIVSEYHGHPDFPPVYGRQPLSRVLELSSPQLREEIHGRVLDRITAALKGAIQKANQQIAATKQALRKPDAGGLLILINDDVSILDPNVLEYEIRRRLSELAKSGQPKISHIDYVFAISSANRVQKSDGSPAFPILRFRGRPSPTVDRVEALVDLIQQQWGLYENVGAIEVRD